VRRKPTNWNENDTITACQLYPHDREGKLTVPEETKEVSRRHTVNQDLIAAERRGEGTEWRVIGWQDDSGVPVGRNGVA
jgi:hypothetical protein